MEDVVTNFGEPLQPPRTPDVGDDEPLVEKHHGDAFEDRIENSLQTLRKNEAIAAKLDVAPARRFVGFDA